jgi:hypothetical protein
MMESFVTSRKGMTEAMKVIKEMVAHARFPCVFQVDEGSGQAWVHIFNAKPELDSRIYVVDK